MYVLIFLLLLPFLVLLLFFLFALLFAWSWVKGKYYGLTGRKPQHKSDPFFHYYNNMNARNAGADMNARNAGAEYREEGQARKTAGSSYGNSRQGGQQNKIFSDKDGEYVDFEMVE